MSDKGEMQTVVEALNQLMTPGTVLKYPEEKVDFKGSRQSAVKSLAVNICSTETQDIALLHKLHSQTRTI